MDSKRPDVRLDASSDEEGLVTKRDRPNDDDDRSLLEKLRAYLSR